MKRAGGFRWIQACRHRTPREVRAPPARGLLVAGTNIHFTDCSAISTRDDHGQKAKKRKLGKRCEERNASLQERHREKRSEGKRRQSQKQEAGNRRWIIQGSKEGKESPKEEKFLTPSSGLLRAKIAVSAGGAKKVTAPRYRGANRWPRPPDNAVDGRTLRPKGAACQDFRKPEAARSACWSIIERSTGKREGNLDGAARCQNPSPPWKTRSRAPAEGGARTRAQSAQLIIMVRASSDEETSSSLATGGLLRAIYCMGTF